MNNKNFNIKDKLFKGRILKSILILLIIIVMFVDLVNAGGVPDGGYDSGVERPGFDPHKPYYGSGFDTTVNLFGGNLIVSGVGASVKGRNGLDINFQPVYSSNEVLLDQNTGATFDNIQDHGPLGLGWNGWHFGRIKIISNSDDSFIVPEIVVEEPNGRTLSFAIDSDHPSYQKEDRFVDAEFSNNKYPGIMLSDGSRIIWYNGNCPVYYRENCGYRFDVGSPEWKKSVQWGKSKFERILPDGTIITYAHFVGSVINIDNTVNAPPGWGQTDWWRDTVGLPEYGDWSDGVSNNAFQNYYPGYYATEFRDTNGNYYTINYYKERKCENSPGFGPLGGFVCYTPIFGSNQFHYDPETYTDSEVYKESMGFHTSATTFGSPYVKSVSIQPYACKDSSNHPGCSFGSNGDTMTNKDLRKMEFFYKNNNVDIINAKLEKVVYTRNQDSDFPNNWGKNSIRFTYTDIDNVHFTLDSARIYFEDFDIPLFPETKYNYDMDSTGGNFFLYMLNSIESPLGGVFEVDYSRNNLKTYCDDQECTRKANRVYETRTKENINDMNPITTKYYYQDDLQHDGVNNPGTRKTFVVGPVDDRGHRTLTIATYMYPYSWSSSFNWKSGLMLQEEVIDATRVDPPVGQIPFHYIGEPVSSTNYFYDSILVGYGKKYSNSIPSGQFYTIRKPLRDGVLSCVYDEIDSNIKRCIFDEYEYWGEHKIQNIPSQGGDVEQGYNDVINYVGTSKQFYDGHYGNVKKITHYGEINSVIKNYYFNNGGGGINDMGYAGKMHGDFNILGNSPGDDVNENYYYQHRRPESNGAYLGYNGNKMYCFYSLGTTQQGCRHWMDEEFVLPRAHATNYIYRTEVKEEFSGNILSAENIEYDELHYSGENVNNLFDGQIFRRYTHEPTIRSLNDAPLSLSVPNLNPTSNIIEIYDNNGNLIETRKTSYKFETTSSIGPFNSPDSVPSYNGVGNVYKIRNPDRQDYPIDNYFTLNTGVVNLNYDSSGVFLKEKREWVYPKDDNGNYFIGGYADGELFQRFYRDEISGTVHAIEGSDRNYARYWYDELGRVTGEGVYQDNPNNQANEWPTKVLSDAYVSYYYYDDNPLAGEPFAVEIKQRKRDNQGVIEYFNPVTNYYDGLGRLIKTEQEYDSNNNLVSYYTYDEQGNKYEETVVPFLETNSAGSSKSVQGFVNLFKGLENVKTTNTLYNGVSSVNLVIPGGISIRYEDYDSLGRVKEVWPFNNPSEKIVNTYGDRYIESVDEKNVKSRSNTDGFGRVTSVVEDVDGNQKITTFEYNNLGQMEKVFDSNSNSKETDYNFNSLGEILNVNNPDAGLQSREYDENGRLFKTIDSNGIETRTIYDSIGNVRKIHYYNNGVLDNTLTKEFKYNLKSIPPHVDFQGYPIYDTTCNDVGKVKSTILNDGESGEEILVRTNYCYDYKGRLVNEDQSIAGNNFNIDYIYDDSDNLIQEVYPDLSVVNYNYDDLGRLDIVDLDGNIIADYDYNPSGTINKIGYGNNVETIYNYDTKNLVESITTNGPDAKIIYQRYYDYDGLGNLISLSGPGNTLIAEYGYDNFNRLIDVNDYGYYGTDITYDYDNVGNRKSITTSSGVKNYQYYDFDGSLRSADSAETNRLGKAGNYDYRYDNRGNLITKTSTNGLGINDESFNYDSSNMLKSINYDSSQGSGISSYFIYDVTGNRVIKKEDASVKQFENNPYNSESTAMALGMNSEVYIARKAVGNKPEIVLCNRFLSNCEYLNGFDDLNSFDRVRDMYFNEYLGLLYLLLDDGVTIKYYTCDVGSCSLVNSQIIGSTTAIDGFTLKPSNNLILNPGHEVDEYQRGVHFIAVSGGGNLFLGIPEKWAIGYEDSNNYVVRNTVEKNEGIYGIEIADLDVNDPMSITYFMPAIENIDYICSAYGKVLQRNSQGSNTWDDGYQDLAMYFFDGSKNRIDTTTYSSDCSTTEICSTLNSNNWQRVSVSRTAPIDTKFVSCFVNSQGLDDGITVWDSFQIEENVLATPYEGYDAKIFVSSENGDVKRYNSDLSQYELGNIVPSYDILNPPSDIVTDDIGQVYVAGNGADEIYVFDYDLTNVVNQFGSNSLDNPFSLDVDEYGNVYVLDSSLRAYKIDPSNGEILSASGTSSDWWGWADYLVEPFSIKVNQQGIFVGDKGLMQGGRMVKFPDPLSFEPLYTYYVLDQFNNIIYEKQRETNVNTAYKFIRFLADPSACDLEGGCESLSNEFDNAYCDATSQCVYDGDCYSSGTALAIDGDSDSYGVCFSFSGEQTWYDCDFNIAQCTSCVNSLGNNVFNGCTGGNCWQPWSNPSGIPGGEYFGFNSNGCCGDDPGEYFVTKEDGTGGGCCSDPGQIVDNSGRCRFPTTGGSSGGSGGSPLIMKKNICVQFNRAGCDWYGGNWDGNSCRC